MSVVEKPQQTDDQQQHAAKVKARAVSGVKVLTVRTFISILLRAASSLCLARLLFPKDFGLFAVTAYISGLATFFSDVGLGAALIRQNSEPTEDELTTVFCGQQIITAVVVALIVATSPFLLQAYKVSSTSAGLLIAMAFGLFLSSLRVIPMMALERSMQFPVIARCELIEGVVQTASTIVLAWLGFGAWALALGGLIRGVTGLVCVWAASPWRPRGKFQMAIVKRLAGHGVTLQLNAVIPPIINGWMPLIVSRFLGVAAVGMVGWATNIASVPMMLSGVLNRVAFPAYSRLQEDPDALERSLRATVRRLCSVFCLAMPVVVIVAPVLIPLMFGHRWTNAVVLVQWFCIEAILLTISGVLAQAQNATGFATDRLGVALATGALRWGAGFFAVVKLGLLGVGPAACAVSGFELFLSAWLIRHRFPRCAPLIGEIAVPVLGSLLLLLAALGVARACGGVHRPWGAALSLVVFLALVAVREFLSKDRPLTKELGGVVRMMRPSAG